MKINKRILFACLLVSGIASAQEFYTCVPKKDWWNNMIRNNVVSIDDTEKIVKENVKKIVKETLEEKDKERWQLLTKQELRKDMPIIGLSSGSYKFQYKVVNFPTSGITQGKAYNLEESVFKKILKIEDKANIVIAKNEFKCVNGVYKNIEDNKEKLSDYYFEGTVFISDKYNLKSCADGSNNIVVVYIYDNDSREVFFADASKKLSGMFFPLSSSFCVGINCYFEVYNNIF